MGQGKRRLAGVLFGTLVAAALAAPVAQADAGTKIEVLSNRADLVSNGDALVAVDLPAGTDASAVKVTVGDRDVSDRFAARPNGRFEGLIDGLDNGPNVVTAKLPDGSGARLTIDNHPQSGPVFSGPHIQPWVCQASARDADCNEPASVGYQYKSSLTGQFSAYDPNSPPADLATTTTNDGQKVPYIVRVETGYQDRDQY